jgi:hypothetical protein
MATYSNNTTIKLGGTFTSATQTVSRAIGITGITNSGGSILTTGATDGGWVWLTLTPTLVTTTAGAGTLSLVAGVLVNGTFEFPLWNIRNTATANVVSILTCGQGLSTVAVTGSQGAFTSALGGSAVSSPFRIGNSTSLTPYIRNLVAGATTFTANFTCILAIESNTP